MARLNVFLLVTSIVSYAQSSFLNYNGPGVFCENRGCCNGRNDSCAVDFSATVCYCDNFCRKTRFPDGDCCPDYPRVCEDASVKRCYDRKYTHRYYDVNKSFVTNCNTCKCASLNTRQMDLMCTQLECMVNEETIRQVNNEGRGWTAGNQTRFWGLRLQDGLNQWLGTNSSRRVMSQYGLQTDKRLDELPRFFDSRQRWRGILLNQVADQNGCNASWAFSTASLLSDRWLIFSNESRRGPLSVHQLLECMLVKDQRGCNPGQLTKALTYIMKNGLVDAELYPDRGLGARASCLIKMRGLKYKEVEVTSAGQWGPTKATVHRCGPSYRLDGQESIMADILDKGPVLATMRVLPELFVYRSGVYSCPRDLRGSRLHSVKIVGWGEENIRGRLVPYWIVANSWGQSWGEDGYMKIQRGVNTCNIEGFVISVTAHDEEPKGAMRRTRAARRRTLDRILRRRV